MSDDRLTGYATENVTPLEDEDKRALDAILASVRNAIAEWDDATTERLLDVEGSPHP